MSVRGLAALGEDGFYECWYVSADGSRVSAGTFESDDKGRANVQMWAGGVDLRDSPTMEVTLEPPDGNPAPSGQVVLRGEAQK